RQRISIVRGPPYLYVYAVHGSNTWGESHHHRLMEILGVVPIGGREAELARGLAELGLRAARDPGDGVEAMRIVPGDTAP
ncbi:MAG TPA: hypothetical protein VK601_27765, partial [Kofleriaceae bacterium]|nr:hypothetical protein [Kofleriaceae bacterium]